MEQKSEGSSGPQHLPVQSLYIDSESRVYLGQSARWAKFLAMAGFAGSAFVIIVFVFVGLLSAFENDMIPGLSWLTSGAFTYFYIGLALLFFFPCLYMYNFAARMQKALRTNDQKQLTLSFQNLILNLRFVGIFTAIGIIIHIILLATMFLASFASMESI